MTYSFTQVATDLRKKQLVVTMSVFSIYLVFILGFRYLSIWGYCFPPHALMLRFLCVLIFLIFVLIYSLRKVLKELRLLQLEITPEEIIFSNVRGIRKLSFSSIEWISVYEYPVKIFLKAKNNIYVIYGYEKMDEIFKAIEIKVDPGIIKRKTRIIDDGNIWSLFWVCMGFGAVFSIPFFIPAISLGIMWFYDSFIAIGAGIYFAYYAPINMRRESPKAIGWVFIGFGLIFLFIAIQKMFNGG